MPLPPVLVFPVHHHHQFSSPFFPVFLLVFHPLFSCVCLYLSFFLFLFCSSFFLLFSSGTESLFAYLEKYNLELESHFTSLLGKHTRRPWTRFVNAENQHLACPEAIDLIDKMLVYDHCERILPREAMRHPYFQPVLVRTTSVVEGSSQTRQKKLLVFLNFQRRSLIAFAVSPAQSNSFFPSYTHRRFTPGVRLCYSCHASSSSVQKDICLHATSYKSVLLSSLPIHACVDTFVDFPVDLSVFFLLIGHLVVGQRHCREAFL